MAVLITERFAEQCDVISNTSFDTCGTITRSSIDYLSPADLAALFAPGGLFADLDSWFITAVELKACGTRTYGLYDWIMGNADRPTGQARANLFNMERGKTGPSILKPFILAAQDSVINTDFWAISNGWANSAYTADVTGPLNAGDKALGAAGDRVVRVISRYGIDLDERWFTERSVVHIFTRTSGVAQDGQWKILAAAQATDQTYVDVLLTSQNAGSDAPYKTDPGAGGTKGVLLVGRNNVNDYEKWCQNLPNYDGRKRVPFWFQTSRRTRCVDEQYLEYFKRLMTPGVNSAFKAFGDLDMAKRNAQDELEDQKRFVNDFFFNKPISVSQTLTAWESLDDITTPTGLTIDPGNGGKVVAKRANFIGVVEQLRRCDRVLDLQGNPLNFYEWLDENYRIMRARRSQGKPVTDIDWYTDSVMRANLQSAYVAYLKNEYGSTNVQFPIKIGETNDLGFVWDSFYVKHPAGVRLNIISHEFFDDWRAANDAEGQIQRGILLLALELGKDGIYWEQLGSNRKVHTVGEIEALARLDKDFACVMESFTQEITLISDTGTVIVSCPANNLWIEGIGDSVPITTGRTANPTYLNLY